jgi:hypothetical protein
VNISDEAVEAAHKAWRVQAGAEGTIFEYNLRASLEAAAPHIAAQAWDRGFDRGFYDPLAGRDRDASESAASNPYRSQA